MSCCAAWQALDVAQRQTWSWQVLHQAAHNRVPFSLHWLARTAHLDKSDAEQLVKDGTDRGWVRQDGRLWVGQLDKGAPT